MQRLAFGHQRPHQFTVAKVRRNANTEDESVAAREQVRRLSLIGPAGLYVIGGTERGVDLFVPITIEVPEQQIERPVWISLKPLKHGGDGPVPGALREGHAAVRSRQPC